MKSHLLTRFAACLILAAPAAPLRADPETTRKQIQALYDTMAALLIPPSQKDAAGNAKAKTMLVLANPAQSVPVAPKAPRASDPDEGGDDASPGSSSDDDVANYQATYYIMADRLMQATPQYNPVLNSTLSASVYEAILNHSTLAPAAKDYTDKQLADFIQAYILVNGELPKNANGTRMTRDQIRALNDKLSEENRIDIPSGEESASNKKAFKDWLKARSAFSAAQSTYSMAQRDKSKAGPQNRAKALNEWHKAQDLWNSRSSDTTAYESALTKIRAWNNASPAVWFYNLNQAYNDYPRLDPKYGGAKPVVFIPNVLTWNPPPSGNGSDESDSGSGGGDGWSKFSFSTADYKSHQEKNSSSDSGSVSANYAGFHGDASFSKTHMDASDFTKSNNFTLSMEIKRVDIFRPWLDDNVWNNPAWQPSQGTALFGKVISWGDVALNGANTRANPMPLAPLVPTTFILARNILLTVKSASTFNAQEANTLSTAVSAGWGPITFSYNHESSSESEDHAKKENMVEFSSKGITLLGYVGEALDRSPAVIERKH